jgi:hypothetical protein
MEGDEKGSRSATIRPFFVLRMNGSFWHVPPKLVVILDALGAEAIARRS